MVLLGDDLAGKTLAEIVNQTYSGATVTTSIYTIST
jgi:hypothetical protein